MNSEDAVLADIAELVESEPVCADECMLCGTTLGPDAASSLFCTEEHQELWHARELDVPERPIPAEVASWLTGGATERPAAKRRGRTLEITHAYAPTPDIIDALDQRAGRVHELLVAIGRERLAGRGIDFTQPVRVILSDPDFARDEVCINFKQGQQVLRTRVSRNALEAVDTPGGYFVPCTAEQLQAVANRVLETQQDAARGTFRQRWIVGVGSDVAPRDTDPPASLMQLTGGDELTGAARQRAAADITSHQRAVIDAVYGRERGVRVAEWLRTCLRGLDGSA